MQVITSNQLFTLILLYCHLHLNQQKAIALSLYNRTETSPEQANQLRSPVNNQTLPVMITTQTRQNSSESKISTNSLHNNRQDSQPQNRSSVSPPVPNKIEVSLRDEPIPTIGKPVELVQMVNNTSDGLDDDDDDDDIDEDEQSQEDEAENEESQGNYADLAKQTGLMEPVHDSFDNNHNTTHQNKLPTYTESISDKLDSTKPPKPVSSQSQVLGREPNKSGLLNKTRNDYEGHDNNYNTNQNRNERLGEAIVRYDIKSRATNVTNLDDSRFVSLSTGRPSELKYSNNARQTDATNSGTIGLSEKLESPSSTTTASGPRVIELSKSDQAKITTTKSPTSSKPPVIVTANATKTNNKNGSDEEQEEIVEDVVEEEEEEDEDEDGQEESDENNDSSMDYEISDSRAGITSETQLLGGVSNQNQAKHHLGYPTIQPPTVYHRLQQPVWARNNSNPWLPTSKSANGQMMSTTPASSLYGTRRPANFVPEEADQDVEESAPKHWTDRVMDVYHQIEGAIQLMVESWKSSKTFESLADRPMILMLIFAGAIIGIALLMMTIVYLINQGDDI